MGFPVSKALATMGWLARRPQYIPEYALLMRKKMSGGFQMEVGADEARKWCAERAMEPADAIEKVTGKRPTGAFAEMFGAEIEEGLRRSAKAVEMGGGASTDTLYWLTELSGAERVIETGVAYGWSTMSILLSLKNRPNARLVSVDLPYPRRNNDRFVGCVVPDELRKQWTLLRWSDRVGVPKALARHGGTIDLAHYDSDKSYEGRMLTYPRMWAALRPGGLMVSDDVADNIGFHDYCKQLGVEPVIISVTTHEGGSLDKYAGVLVKR